MQNWDDIKWIFELDGTLRDIYIQEVSIIDWEKLIDLLNKRYSLKYFLSDDENYQTEIDKENVIKSLNDETGNFDIQMASIQIGEIQINCHFFLPDQIEFDLDPKEISSIEDCNKVMEYMEDISQTLSTQVTLTGENSPKFPLIKIDMTKGIRKILTEDEANKFLGDTSFSKKYQVMLNTKLKMRYFTKKFKEQLLKSASNPYKSTKKNENIW
jgi:hypothetical protein